MRGQNAFVFNLNMIIHIFLHLSNAFSPGPAGRRGRGEAFSRFWMPAAGGCVPFCRRTPCRNLVLLPKNGRRQGGKTLHSAKFWEPEPLRPPGSLVPPAAGPPCRQGSPKEPLRATTGKVRGAAKNFSQGRSFPFLSTLPARGATRPSHRRWSGPNISIHALRKGSDPRQQPKVTENPNFYPRSPQGERLLSVFQPVAGMVFLSTLPARGATVSGA